MASGAVSINSQQLERERNLLCPDIGIKDLEVPLVGIPEALLPNLLEDLGKNLCIPCSPSRLFTSDIGGMEALISSCNNENATAFEDVRSSNKEEEVVYFDENLSYEIEVEVETEPERSISNDPQLQLVSRESQDKYQEYSTTILDRNYIGADEEFIPQDNYQNSNCTVLDQNYSAGNAKQRESDVTFSRNYNNRSNFSPRVWKTRWFFEPLLCKVCQLAFSSKDLLKRHKQISHKIIPQQCLKCKNTFPSISRLARHQKLKHSIEMLIKNTRSRSKLRPSKKPEITTSKSPIRHRKPILLVENLFHGSKFQDVIEDNTCGEMSSKSSSCKLKPSLRKTCRDNQKFLHPETEKNCVRLARRTKSQNTFTDKSHKTGSRLRRRKLLCAGDECDLLKPGKNNLNATEELETNDNNEKLVELKLSQESSAKSCEEYNTNTWLKDKLWQTEQIIQKYRHLLGTSNCRVSLVDLKHRFHLIDEIGTDDKEKPSIIEFAESRDVSKCGESTPVFAGTPYQAEMAIKSRCRLRSCRLDNPSVEDYQQISNKNRSPDCQILLDDIKRLTECSICKNMIPFIYLTAHKKQHEVECHICGKNVLLGNVTKHGITHIANLHCEICNFRAASKQCLWEHMNMHFGVKPLYCEICGQAFNRNSGLRDHVKEQHKNISPPYKCEFCEFRSFFPSGIRKHKLQHFKGRCFYCSEKFTNRKQFQIHLLRVHKSKSNKL